MMVSVKKLNPDWDLSQLYNSFEDPSFILELSQAEVEFTKLKELLVQEVEITTDYLIYCLNRIDLVFMLLSKVSSYVNLTLLVNSSHCGALQYNGRISTLQADSSNILKLLHQKTGTLPNIEDLISNNEELLPYAYLLNESGKSSKHNASLETENVITKMQLTGSREWQNLRNSLDGAVKIPFTINGEEKILTLSEIRALASDSSKDIRRAAYITELASYKGYEVPMAHCLSSIKGEGITTAALRGFDTVLDQMLDINKMDQRALDTMMSSIEANLPAFHNYLKYKGKLLGYENGLPWYELLSPIGKSTLKFTYEEACECLTNIFTSFDKDMGLFINRAFSNQWIDAFPKKGKVSGALCADLPTLRQSRIFANFNGSYSDMRTLAHELGHAFHARCLDEVPLVMRDAPTPVCETASIFNETIVQEYMMKTVSSDEQIFILEAGLRESTQTVVDMYSRFLFEKEVFNRRKTHSLSANELCEIMKTSQLTAYGDSLDPNYLHPYMWMCKVHYYIPDFHYYNFPYTFGLLFAKGLYANYKNNTHSFMKQYIELLQATCSDNMTGIMKRANIDIYDQSFWDKSLASIVDDINKFIDFYK